MCVWCIKVAGEAWNLSQHESLSSVTFNMHLGKTTCFVRQFMEYTPFHLFADVLDPWNEKQNISYM